MWGACRRAVGCTLLSFNDPALMRAVQPQHQRPHFYAHSVMHTPALPQDNEPLMRALSSLINVNTPNLVLFVGEALVGNDAVDQLVKFNRCVRICMCGCAHVRVGEWVWVCERACACVRHAPPTAPRPPRSCDALCVHPYTHASAYKRAHIHTHTHTCTRRALQDLAPPTATVRHAIDGVVLTKFDTIDDKVRLCRAGGMQCGCSACGVR